MKRRWSMVLVAACAVAGCGDSAGGGGGADDAGPSPACTQPPCPQIVAEVPYAPVREVDMLFLVDDSGSMGEEQVSFVSSFSGFARGLSAFSSGLPNLHIGVVSPNLGSGPFEIMGCDGDGLGGVLQNEPRSACSPPTDRFISDVANPDGTRATNYDGNLAEAFSCIARLGIAGCGFEQPLAAMRRALDESNPENAGFLRDGAWLHLVILTDEDDCSVSDTAMFDDAPAGVDDPLGPLSSFRCFEFGVVCDDDQPRAEGPRLSCAPRADSPYMPAVADYIAFFRGLKADPSMVLVSVIAAPPTPVAVGRNEDGEPRLEAGCEGEFGQASPGVRLAAFADGFPERSSYTTICDTGLNDSLIDVGALLARVADDTPCLFGPVHLPAACTVEERVGDAVQQTFPECDAPDAPAGSSNQPCWILEEDPEDCASTDSNLAIRVFPTDRPLPADARLVVTCRVDDAP